eukprot:2839531-Rhodomonas_salina.3
MCGSDDAHLDLSQHAVFAPQTHASSASVCVLTERCWRLEDEESCHQLKISDAPNGAAMVSVSDNLDMVLVLTELCC